MVKNRNSLNRCIPLLCALVVLICCVPVAPAAAASVYYLDGSWMFDSYIVWDGEFAFDYSFTLDGDYYDGFWWDPEQEELWLVLHGEDNCAYSGGWEGVIPIITFDDRIQVTEDEYEFFTSNLKKASYDLTFDLRGGTWPDGSAGGTVSGMEGDTISGIQTPVMDGCIFTGWTHGGYGSYDAQENEFTFGAGNALLTANWTQSLSTYTSTIKIDGQSYTFTGTGSKPQVSIEVTDEGVRLSCDLTQYNYYYPGEGTFYGLSYTQSGAAAFVPGERYQLAAGDHTFYTVSSASLGQFTTTINIYNNAGNQLMYSFAIAADGQSPRVTVAVSSAGISFSTPDTEPVWFSGVYETFTGLALQPHATVPAVVLGQTIAIGGGQHNSVLDLFYTFDASLGGDEEVSRTLAAFVDFLIDPVLVFFETEFVPGFSFGELAVVAFLLGLLFWFLRVFK